MTTRTADASPSHSPAPLQPTTPFADLIADARRKGAQLDDGWRDLVPTDEAAAYAVQRDILRASGATIGGWKIGAKTATGPIFGAPLPADGMHAPGGTLRRDACPPCGLELELAFRFGRTFAPRAEPYSDEEVLAGIGSFGVTVELVASRFASWPDLPRLAMLADLQCHGALIVGTFVPYRGDYPFLTPSMHFTIDDIDIVQQAVQGNPANTAGDPRRLLPWVVNHCTGSLGVAVTPEWVMTAGSYTGLYVPTTGGRVRGEIDGLPPVAFTLI